MKKLAVMAIVLALLGGCDKPGSQRSPRRADQSTAPLRAAAPTARQPTLDPKSSAAAEQLVRAFAQLLGHGNFDEAYMLLGPTAPPRRSFDADFSRIRDLQVSVGSAGDQDGAMGSIYISVPLTASGTEDGRHISRSGKAVLRRVNDVPGSTEAQRHWHIERIDWDRG